MGKISSSYNKNSKTKSTESKKKVQEKLVDTKKKISLSKTCAEFLLYILPYAIFKPATKDIPISKDNTNATRNLWEKIVK